MQLVFFAIKFRHLKLKFKHFSYILGGIIHQPYFKSTDGKLGRSIWGVKELGSGGYQSKKAPENKFIITTTRSHSNALVQTTLDAIRPDEILRVGGCGYKVLQVMNISEI